MEKKSHIEIRLPKDSLKRSFPNDGKYQRFNFVHFEEFIFPFILFFRLLFCLLCYNDNSLWALWKPFNKFLKMAPEKWTKISTRNLYVKWNHWAARLHLPLHFKCLMYVFFDRLFVCINFIPVTQYENHICTWCVRICFFIRVFFFYLPCFMSRKENKPFWMLKVSEMVFRRTPGLMPGKWNKYITQCEFSFSKCVCARHTFPDII